jgi:hypothetical protein
VPTLLSGPERVDQIKQILTVSFKRSLFMLLYLLPRFYIVLLQNKSIQISTSILDGVVFILRSEFRTGIGWMI